MSRSTAYLLTLLSVVIVGVVVVSKYFGVHVPVLGEIARGNYFEMTLVAYVLLLLPAILR